MKYGWIVDKPDFRDLIYEPEERGILPESVDLRPGCPPIYDQGNLGSCTANAIAGHLDFNRKKQGEEFIFPSRLFIYYQERLLENSVESDSGASIRDSVKVVKKFGACPEQEWPYEIDMFTVEPHDFCYEDAVKYEDLTYLRILQDELSMKSCLAEGYPFVVGVSVYESFEKSNGDVPIPKPSESLLGGHAICIVGYDKDYWIFRNSWGTSFGNEGYGTLPKEYLLNPGLSRDSWSLRKVK